MSALGEALKEARHGQKLSLEEIQDMTKIQKRYLLAIEQGNYEQLPGKFYARAFIKNYAEAVGLDPDALFDQYAGEIPSTGQDIPENLPPRANRKTSPASSTQSKLFSLIPKLLVAVLLIGLCVAVWAIWQKEDPGSQPEQSGDSGSPIEVDKGNGIPEDDQKDASGSEGDQGEKESSQEDQKGDQAEKQEPQQKLVKTKTQGNSTYYTLKNTDTFKLKLTAEGSHSWVEVKKSGADGEAYMNDPLQEGKSQSFDLSSQQNIYVEIGSTPHVKMTINGKPFDYPDGPAQQKFYITFKKS